MSELEAKFNFLDRDGRNCEGTVQIEDYKAAAEHGVSLSQYMEQKFDTNSALYGSVFQQALASHGFVVKPDAATGLQSTKLSDMFSGMSIKAGAITSPDGTANNTPAGRLFFPEVILQSISKTLSEDKSDFFAGYESLIGGTETVNAPEFKRAVIDDSAPEASESMSTAQLAEPPIMVSITAEDRTTPIPGKAIGMIVSDQALQSTSLDLVTLVMGRQAYGERVRMVEGQLSDVISGNSDLNLTALTTINSSTLDSAATSGATFTQKAWIHYLRDNYQTMNISNIVCTIDTALFLEGRANKPTNQDDDPNSPRIDSLFSIDNLGIVAPRVFLVASSVVPDDRVVGLDNRWALRRYVNVSASYQAIEAFAIRRATAMRVDYGEALTRLYDDAFRVMDFA